MRWLDWSKAIALLLIALNHSVERMGIYPLIANPESNWAPLADRVAQLKPTTGSAWDVVFNAIRYPGLLGEVGVAIFVIASGLALTNSAMRRGELGADFGRRRAERIAPSWIVVHLLALVASLPVLLFVGGRAADLVAAPWDGRFWASLAGLRIFPSTIYYLVPCWWFIALLIQLYLVFPFLYRLLVKWGPNKYWYVVAGAVAVKLAGLVVFDSYLDTWARGAIFITRLPEFAFGMMAALWLAGAKSPLRNRWVLPAALVAIPIGLASSLTLVGNAWGPFLFGAGLFVVLYRVMAGLRLEGRVGRAGSWVGRHSLALFLVHQPILYVLVPGGMAGPARVLGGLAVAAALIVLAGVTFEDIVARAERTWKRWSSLEIIPRRVGAVLGVAVVVYAALVGLDALVRANDPQEALGWGERPSLIADDTLGWKLAPDQTTRLRWQSYDYTVTSNRFGFPGPAVTPAAGQLRILTLGDAFTSAEGVDTADAWPRLLDTELGGEAVVWNGAVSGYGPQQYAAVAEQLVPQLQPDVIVVGFFVNDFSDAASNLEGVQEGIGFSRADPTGLVPSLQWANLSKYLRYHVTEPLLAKVGIPNRTGYGLGQFDQFEPGNLGPDRPGYDETRQALSEIRQVAPEARLVMMLVPASIQVCGPGDLEYFPANVDLADFDLEQPQRLAESIAGSVGMEVLDLREPLRAAPQCPYQPANMHWLEAGHEIAATTLRDYLAST
jgi:peptidoglycan/LPS O-acetylase OafA/YrhL